jgi:ribA/ribD-fused uncharacterized protein
MNPPDRIDSFSGAYFFLSNYSSSVLSRDGVTFPTVEHAFAAAKTTDAALQTRIADAPTPGDAKRLGRTVTLRRDWDRVRVGVMRELLDQKFARPGLAARLVATGDALLVEGNDWGDRFWGECDVEGANMLGRLLMELRTGITAPGPEGDETTNG